MASSSIPFRLVSRVLRDSCDACSLWRTGPVCSLASRRCSGYFVTDTACVGYGILDGCFAHELCPACSYAWIVKE